MTAYDTGHSQRGKGRERSDDAHSARHCHPSMLSALQSEANPKRHRVTSIVFQEIKKQAARIREQPAGMKGRQGRSKTESMRESREEGRREDVRERRINAEVNRG